MEAVESMQIRDNDLLFKNIVEVFKSKIIPIEISKKFTKESILLTRKEDYILSYPDIKHCFLGYDVKTIQEALDDYEFYLYILNLFNGVGNLFKSSTYLNNEYSEKISVAFYNYHTDEIEYWERHFTKKVNQHQENLHLFFLEGIKTLVHHLLIFIIDKDLNYDKLEIFKESFEIKQKYENEID